MSDPGATPRLGRLLLIPTPLGQTDPDRVLPRRHIAEVVQLTHFVAENAKIARAFLKKLPLPRPLQSLVIAELNEHTPRAEVARLLQPAIEGVDLGLMSDAGCPGIADPGALLVDEAHRRGVIVAPLVGPSSLVLALMASGLNGQSFVFHGYLPVDAGARGIALRNLEETSAKTGQSQIFIETPYRNLPLLDAIFEHCRGDSRLCVAADLTSPAESIGTRTVAQWRQFDRRVLHKRPAIFLLEAMPATKTR